MLHVDRGRIQYEDGGIVVMTGCSPQQRLATLIMRLHYHPGIEISYVGLYGTNISRLSDIAAHRAISDLM